MCKYECVYVCVITACKFNIIMHENEANEKSRQQKLLMEAARMKLKGCHSQVHSPCARVCVCVWAAHVA